MSKQSESYLPLSFHLQDTADVMDYLLRTWVSPNMCSAMGISRKEMRTAALFLAYVHDIGKATNAFQYKITCSVPAAREHMEQLGFNLIAPDPAERIFTHHSIAGAAILSLLGVPSWAVSVVGAHHGSTIEAGVDFSDVTNLYRSVFFDNKCHVTQWQRAWHDILDLALEEGNCPTLHDLPQNIPPKAQLLLSGLLIMADWLSSNTRLFPLFSAESIVLDSAYPARSTRALAALRLPMKWQPDSTWQYSDLYQLRFRFDAANFVQQAMQSTAADIKEPGLFILEAPMGSGKTEAALAVSEILADRLQLSGLAFLLPSQATANTMFTRVCSWAKQFSNQQAGWSEHLEKMSMELAHSKSYLNDEFTELICESNSIDDDDASSPSALTAHSFFLGRKTQLLADFVVGTVDQLLMGALRQKHIMLRHLGLAGKVVIIDEIHAYDAYMSRYLDCMLSWLGSYHVPVILLSATLPGQRRCELARAYLNQKKPFEEAEKLIKESCYPLLTVTEGEQVLTKVIPSDTAMQNVYITRGAVDDSEVVSFLQNHIAGGGCVGVIVNTVKRAQKLTQILHLAFPDWDIILDHAQFTMPDRIRREQEIMNRVGKASMNTPNRRLIVVGTQVLEQSLDIDFDIMVSELCPMDLLLQRIGRLHRHFGRSRPAALQRARCLVLDASDSSKKIYDEYLLCKTDALLKDTIQLPNDISPLVQSTYALTGEEDPLHGKQEIYLQMLSKKEEKAGQMCITTAPRTGGRHASTSTINGLTNRRFDFTDAQQEAAVRDSTASIEVLVLRYGEDNLLHPVTDKEKSISVSPNTMPSNEEAKIILRQSLRLPYWFSLPWQINEVLSELEQLRQHRLQEWTQSKLIGRELFLLLDKNGYTMLHHVNIKYDSDLGLCYTEKEEGKDEGQGV